MGKSRSTKAASTKPKAAPTPLSPPQPPSSLPSWKNQLARFIKRAGAPTIALTALTMDSMTKVGVMLAVAWVWGLFEVSTDTAWSRSWKVGSGIIWSFLLLSAMGAILYFEGESKSPPPEALFSSQLQELKDLDQFIGHKSEGDLQELFDFPKILFFNRLL